MSGGYQRVSIGHFHEAGVSQHTKKIHDLRPALLFIDAEFAAKYCTDITYNCGIRDQFPNPRSRRIHGITVTRSLIDRQKIVM
jgi:hypothetical protein